MGSTRDNAHTWSAAYWVRLSARQGAIHCATREELLSRKLVPRQVTHLPRSQALPSDLLTASAHYTFRLRSFDGTPLAASYYPSHLGNSSPVVMLIHEMGRSRKDFEDPVQDLKGQGLAAHLQGLGFAVFSMDLRWQGQNPRRALSCRRTAEAD